MGRYSDSDDSEYRSSKKSKKKRRSRSRSRSDDSSSKHKKKKSKRNKRSRSPKRRRSRSRSRSRDRRRRSRSGSRSRRSRSSSRSRRSRSRSYERRRRSRSRSRDRRRSSSNSRSSPRESTRESKRSYFRPESDPSSIPGFALMTPIEQNEVKMQLALKAADLATEKLKAAGMLEDDVTTSTRDVTSGRKDFGLSVQEMEKRRKAIENIDSDNFKQAQFKTSLKTQNQTKKISAKKELELSHDSAIFGDLLAGTGMDEAAFNRPKSVEINDPKSLMGPVFFEPESVKMARWIDKLKDMRRHSHSNGSAS